MTTGTQTIHAIAPDSSAGAQLTSHVQSAIAMPAWRLAITMVLISAGLSAAWIVVCTFGPWRIGLAGETAFSGIVGIAVTSAIALAGLLMMTPWKRRPMMDWMTMWLAGTVFRMLATPTILFLLYSAVSHALLVKPLVLAVALTALVSVLAEAGIMASHVRRSLPSL